jgi:hypothetical protein
VGDACLCAGSLMELIIPLLFIPCICPERVSQKISTAPGGEIHTARFVGAILAERVETGSLHSPSKLAGERV